MSLWLHTYCVACLLSFWFHCLSEMPQQDRLTQWSYYNRMVKIHSLVLLPLHWVRQEFSIQWSCLSLKNLACYSLLVFPPYYTKVSLKHNKLIYILVCREKQPHKKDRIFFLKIDNNKNKSWTFFWSDFVPGRPGTEEFVPGQLLLPLSRDKGTPGQGKCPCPGTKGQRDVPSRFVPGRPAGRPVPWKR